MTVAELIEKLQTFPQDVQVYVDEPGTEERAVIAELNENDGRVMP